MKQRNILVIAAVAVVLVGAAVLVGPQIYRAVTEQSAADAPTLDVTAEPGVTDQTPDAVDVDLSALSGEWRIESGSFAGYRVDEVLNGTEVTVTGRTEQVSGSIRVSGATLESADVTVDVGSIVTDSDRRDAFFRDSAMRVDEFPTATFVLGSPVTSAEALAVDVPVTQTLEGELTLAGVTQRVSVEAEAVLTLVDGTPTVQVVGAIPVVFSDYGVTAPNLGFVQVEPEGLVEFSIRATLA